MQPTKYIWLNGELVEWDKAQIHVLTHAMHYGSGAFEGIRVYKTEQGGAVFRLKEHIDRLFYSASTFMMEVPYTREALTEATLNLLRENRLEQGYIRPIVYFGYAIMGLNPKNSPVHVAIAAWPWGAYLPHESIDVKISKFCRIHPGSTVADAKLTGHYSNSIMASLELKDTKYHEALFLDYKGDVAEGPGENFFMIKDGVLYTPPLGSILAGITRDTIMTLAQANSINVVERVIKPVELSAADEAFFTGTAAEVTPINSINDKVLGKGGVGPITAKLKQAYLDVVYGRDAKFKHYLSYINA